MSGNTPISKHRLTNLDNQNEKNGFKIFNINTGILLGPVDFFRSKASIIFSTSPGTVGARKKELAELIIKLPFLSFLLK